MGTADLRLRRMSLCRFARHLVRFFLCGSRKAGPPLGFYLLLCMLLGVALSDGDAVVSRDLME